MNPPADKVARYVTALHALKAEDRLRDLKPRAGIDFASNDYLALASAPRMRRAVAAALEAGTPIGAGGSRLLRGKCAGHGFVGAEGARVFGAGKAVFFVIGRGANFSALAKIAARQHP